MAGMPLPCRCTDGEKRHTSTATKVEECSRLRACLSALDGLPAYGTPSFYNLSQTCFVQGAINVQYLLLVPTTRRASGGSFAYC